MRGRNQAHESDRGAVLVATVVAWVGVWGITDETVQLVQSRAARSCIYAALLGGAIKP